MITIVIVNWNAGIQLFDVISSIIQYHHKMVASVIIIDNASIDDSLAKVETLQDLPFRLQIIRNKENRGFAAACNQGVVLATGDYLLFLNPDTRLFDNSLTAPLNYMQDRRNADVGIVGIQLINEANQVSHSCSRFPTLFGFAANAIGINRVLPKLGIAMVEWNHAQPQEVDQVIGAFFLVRRTLFDLLHGFDECFFVYFEEVDLSFRAKHSGFRSVYLTDAKAFHAGGGTSRQVKVHRLFYSLRSRLLYGFKHFSPWQAWTLVLLTLSVEWVTRTGFALMSNGIEGVRNTWAAYGMLWRDMSAILARRHQ